MEPRRRAGPSGRMTCHRRAFLRPRSHRQSCPFPRPTRRLRHCSSRIRRSIHESVIARASGPFVPRLTQSASLAPLSGASEQRRGGDAEAAWLFAGAFMKDRERGPMRIKISPLLLRTLVLAVVAALVLAIPAPTQVSSAPIGNSVLARAVDIELGLVEPGEKEQLVSSGAVYAALLATGELDKRASAAGNGPSRPFSRHGTQGCSNR